MTTGELFQTFLICTLENFYWIFERFTKKWSNSVNFWAKKLFFFSNGSEFHQKLIGTIRGRSFMTSATLGGGGGQPNSDICWQGGEGGSVKVWHFADARWRGAGVLPEVATTKFYYGWHEKWSKWFKSWNEPKNNLFILFSQGFKKLNFPTSWKISLRLVGGGA